MVTDSEIQEWIVDLLAMYEKHSVELDHKDCGELAELLSNLSKSQTEQIKELRKRNPYNPNKDKEYYFLSLGWDEACDELEKMQNEK